MNILYKKALLIGALLSSLLMPTFVFAATSNIGFDGLDSLLRSFANGVVRSTGYMMFTLAVVAFFWGIIKFIWSARNGADGKGATGGKSFMVWGLIALFVMFSVWGIVKFAQGVFGIQGDTTIIVPDLNFKGTSSATTNDGPNSPGWNADGTRTTVNGGLGNGSGSRLTGSPCGGKVEGQACLLPSGNAGVCTTNEDSTFGCYVKTNTVPTPRSGL